MIGAAQLMDKTSYSRLCRSIVHAHKPNENHLVNESIDQALKNLVAQQMKLWLNVVFLCMSCQAYGQIEI